jgi:hypothetical protein
MLGILGKFPIRARKMWLSVHMWRVEMRKERLIMRYGFTCATFLFIAVTPVVAQNKGANAKATTATDADYEALAQAKEVVGVIRQVDGSDKRLTLQYQYQDLIPNQRAIANANRNLSRQQQQILRQYNQALKTKNPYQRAQKLQALAIRAQNMGVNTGNLYTVKNGRVDFDLRALENVKVRQLQPPVEYDDKGNRKEYTKKELKELKGKDPSLPGYTGSWENVSVGQTVKLYLKTKKKKKEKDQEKEGKDDKDKDNDKKKKDKKGDKDDADLDDDNKPVVSMIVIMKEPESDNRPMKK